MTLNRRSLLCAAGLSTATALIAPGEADANPPARALSPRERELSLRAYVDAQAPAWGNALTAGDPHAVGYAHPFQTAVFFTPAMWKYLNSHPATELQTSHSRAWWVTSTNQTFDEAGFRDVLTRLEGFQNALDHQKSHQKAIKGAPALRENIDRLSYRTTAGPTAVDRQELRKLLYSRAAPSKPGGRAVVLDWRQGRPFVNGIDLTALKDSADAFGGQIAILMAYLTAVGVVELFARPPMRRVMGNARWVGWGAIGGYTLYYLKLRRQISDLEDLVRENSTVKQLPGKLFTV